MARPQRRSGLSEHSSANHRLCARAPAMSNSPSTSPPMPRPAPNGADAPPRDGVGVGEDDLTGDTVGVELLVAVRGVPAPFEPLFVLLVPLLDELVLVATRAHHRRAHLGALHRVVVEGLAILRFEVVAVLRVGKAGVRVRRDDEIALVRHSFRSCSADARVDLPGAGISAFMMDERAER